MTLAEARGILEDVAIHPDLTPSPLQSASEDLAAALLCAKATEEPVNASNARTLLIEVLAKRIPWRRLVTLPPEDAARARLVAHARRPLEERDIIEDRLLTELVATAAG